MTIRRLLPLLISGVLRGSVCAATLHTGAFISVPDYFNGFEAIATDQFAGSSYTEGGIVVSYVGAFRPEARFVSSPLDTAGIWTTWTPQIGGEGSYGWYAPGEGFTSVRLASGSEIESIQLLAGSGWGYSSTFMQFELLLKGAVVAAGDFSVTTGNFSTAAWARGGQNGNGAMSHFGFSGGGFDEVRLQNLGQPESPFNSGGFEAGAYDSISIVMNPGSPIPHVPDTSSTLSLMSLGVLLLLTCSMASPKRVTNERLQSV